MARQRLLLRLEQEWKALLESFEGLPDDALLEPGVVGQWSIRDVLAHITTWENEALKALPLILNGESPPRYASYGGIDAFNAREQERKRGLSLKRVREELAATHEQLIAFLEHTLESHPAPTDRFQRRLRLDTYNHYREHAGQIKAWRMKRGL